ncbi:unnamed protein product [Brassica rapa subsp. narinosa]
MHLGLLSGGTHRDGSQSLATFHVTPTSSRFRTRKSSLGSVSMT